jgi:hypothetical protein
MSEKDEYIQWASDPCCRHDPGPVSNAGHADKVDKVPYESKNLSLLTKKTSKNPARTN